MKTIVETVAEEHRRINEISEELRSKLYDLSENPKESEVKELLSIFLKLKWNLEKHMFVEEKVMINSYISRLNDGKSETASHIVKDHREIIEFLVKIEEKIRDGRKPSIDSLMALISGHEKLEEKIFYPKLDEELTTEEKEIIINRSEEVLIG